MWTWADVQLIHHQFQLLLCWQGRLQVLYRITEFFFLLSILSTLHLSIHASMLLCYPEDALLSSLINSTVHFFFIHQVPRDGPTEFHSCLILNVPQSGLGDTKRHRQKETGCFINASSTTEAVFLEESERSPTASPTSDKLWLLHHTEHSLLLCNRVVGGPTMTNKFSLSVFTGTSTNYSHKITTAFWILVVIPKRTNMQLCKKTSELLACWINVWWFDKNWGFDKH